MAAEQVDAARAVLPLLPALVFDADVRSVHINQTGESSSDYTLRAVPDAGFADAVAAYEFDALTIDLPVEGFPVRELMDTAPLTFVLIDQPAESPAAGDSGINWMLTILGRPGSYAWDLRALHR